MEDLRDEAGHFCVDVPDRQPFLLVKCATHNPSPWRFTFQPDDIETLVQDHNRGGLFGGSYVCLNCSFDSLGVFQDEEWSTLFDLGGSENQQTITLRRTPGTSFTVTGSAGRLTRTIPASRFPLHLFE
jgi:hypothetical protein